MNFYLNLFIFSNIFNYLTKNNFMKNNFIKSTFVLTMGSVLAKVFSAVYRIALTRILGGVGIGIYQLIFPFYSLCVVLATAGLPMAISKVISKHKDNELEVLKKSLMFTSIVSLVLTFILVLSSYGLASLQGQKDITICYLILAPTIVVVGGISVLRGYFQGKHNFFPSAISNIVEQFVKLVAGLVLSLSLISLGLIPAIMGAIIGIVVSECVALLVLILYLKNQKITRINENNISIKLMLKDILPITLTNILLPISSFIDSILVVNILSLNFNNNTAVFMYGLESGAVSSLISLPSLFSFAIASVILPNITHEKSNFNNNNKLEFALKLVLIITIPCAVCFMLIPNRLIGLIYHNRLNAYGINGLNIASRLLAISSVGVVFLSISQIYSSSLQATDNRMATIRNLAIAIILKLVIEVVFMPSKIMNIYALAISNIACYIAVMVLNHLEIKQILNFKIPYAFWAKLIFSNTTMVFALVSILSIHLSAFNTIVGILFAIVVYFASLILTNIFSKKDKAILKYKV